MNLCNHCLRHRAVEEIQSAIEKHGVHQINPVGEKFDYSFHQAMFEVPTMISHSCEEGFSMVMCFMIGFYDQLWSAF